MFNCDHRFLQPHAFCKVISEFALEYRTVRQRVLDQKRKKEDHRKRTKTRGKLITESGAYGNVEVYTILSQTTTKIRPSWEKITISVAFRTPRH